MEHREEPYGSLRDDDPPDDTSGGPLSSGAGKGSGQRADGAPDGDVPGGAPDSGDATRGAEGGGGERFEDDSP
jgi:hypothetical protein